MHQSTKDRMVGHLNKMVTTKAVTKITESNTIGKRPKRLPKIDGEIKC